MNKQRQLVYHPEAEKELDEATAWYYEKGENLRTRFEEEYRKKASLILYYPERYAKRHGYYRETKLKSFPYLIVYRYNKTKNSITISSVHHTSKNSKNKYRQ
jgi:plasmid stabilization system protein ParE